MPIIDNIKKSLIKVKTLFEEKGAPGTEMFSGFITEEFNPDLVGTRGIKLYDQMRKNDAQIHATLEAIKLPLISAVWFIEEATTEEDDTDPELLKEQAQFIENNLMNDLNWKRQLRLILTYLDFGYKYLEKVYGLDKDGRIYWKKWGDRQQSAHNRWENDNKDVGVEQMLPVVDDGNNMPFTPIEKLLLFSYNREGDNYEGVSVLRTAYKHWWFKDTLYKIQGISAERYGVGVPWVKMGESGSGTDRTDAENMAKNLRSNETSYAVTPQDWDFQILTPGSDPKAGSIKDAIDHHNRMITMNILAPFLDLGSGSAGSFALSKDQSTFFMLGLRAIADDVISVVNDAIKELILMNWPETTKFPTLNVTDIGQTDMQAFSTSMNTLVQGGLISADEELEDFIRDSLKLPSLPEKTDEDLELEDLENEMAVLQADIAGEQDPIPEGQEGQPTDDSVKDAKEENKQDLESEQDIEEGKQRLSETQKSIEASQTNIVDAKRCIDESRLVISDFKTKSRSIKNRKLKREFNKSVKNKIDKIRGIIKRDRSGVKDKTNKKVDARNLAEKKNLKMTKREQEFNKAITDNEKIINDDYVNFEKQLVETENQIKRFLTKKMDKADTKMINGVASIKGSNRLFNEVKAGVNDIMKKFQIKVSGGSLSRQMMKSVAKNAVVASADLTNNKQLANSLLIAEPQLRSFMAGHISNMDAVVFNEGRQVLESMHDNITQEVSLRLTKQQIDQIKFNRNIFQLSAVAHPRGLFRSIVLDDAKKQGTNHFKLIVPPNKTKDILPSGNTAKNLFIILTLQQWNERTGTKNNVNTVGGLGLHHNSFEYFYPVDEEILTEEQEIAKQQRSEFNN